MTRPICEVTLPDGTIGTIVDDEIWEGPPSEIRIVSCELVLRDPVAKPSAGPVYDGNMD